LLRVELAYLAELEIEFDLTLTGFETAEIDVMLDPEGTSSEPDAFDACPPPKMGGPAVSRVGDLWQLGRHRLLCGDATQAESFDRLLNGRPADLVFTDPPYNVPVDGHARGLGRTRHREFMMAAGEMSETEFRRFLCTVLGHMVQHTRLGSIHFICMDWRHIGELLAAARGLYAEVKNLCVWVKANAGMGSLYRSQHELVLVLKNGRAPHVNNVHLGRLGCYRTNVWNYPGVNSWGPGRGEALALHPTVKPVALIADAIRDCSKRHALVLDPFLGSGTTLLAAERTQRTAYAIEIDPYYVDVAVRRFRKATGQTAVHVGTGLEFEAVREQRLSATKRTGLSAHKGCGKEK
jgi:16S rRNA G966 N2-methylase RsmD